MSLHAGERFADYTVISRVGAGGMGEVYLVQHPRLPRRDALKVLPANVSVDSQFRQRFLREADIAASLMHPNVVSVHDRGDHRGRLWIAMDFIQGSDAAELVRKRYPAGMPYQECVDIIAAVASALDYAHVRGLLHRDVKPANILLTEPDTRGRRSVYLTDFGIARRIDDISGLTETDVAVGTFTYASPEQVMGRSMDGRVDQYALAGTAYHLLTGSVPYSESSLGAMMMAHVNAAPPSIGRLRPDLAVLDTVFAKAMAKEARERFATCEEFAAALAGGSISEQGSFQAPQLREGLHFHSDPTQQAVGRDETKQPAAVKKADKVVSADRPRHAVPADTTRKPPEQSPPSDYTRLVRLAVEPTNRRPLWRRPWVIIAGGVTFAVVIAGVALAISVTLSKSIIKPEGAAQSVVDLVSEKTDFKPTDVKCPDGVEAKVGQEFDCSFTGPDGDYTAHMKVLKIDGEQVLFDINTKLKK
jgi:serine/threonine protein kinase